MNAPANVMDPVINIEMRVIVFVINYVTLAMSLVSEVVLFVLLLLGGRSELRRRFTVQIFLLYCCNY
jgi:hypothetical protein